MDKLRNFFPYKFWGLVEIRVSGLFVIHRGLLVHGSCSLVKETTTGRDDQ